MNSKLVFLFISSIFLFNNENSISVSEREPILEFELEDINGVKISTSDYKGKVIYLDVWATWCLPCRVLYPKSQKLHDEYENEDIVFIYISVDHEIEKWKRFINKKQPKGVNLIANDHFVDEFMMKYKIVGIPRFMLIDKKGRVVDSDAARPNWPELKDQINKLLQE